MSEDGLTWTFKLRDGVTFQNGEAMKASDVVYSYERCFDNAYMQEKVEAIDSVTAPDDSTIEIHLKYQFSPLMEKLLPSASSARNSRRKIRMPRVFLALTPAVPELIPWQRLSLM